MRFYLPVILSILVFSKAAHAMAPAGDVTFGPEFAFTRQDIFETFPAGKLTIKTEKSVAAIEEFASHIKEKFERETGSKLDHKKIIRRRGVVLRTHHRLIFSDGFYIELLPDPGVIEVITKPGTLKEFQSRKDVVQKFLFDVGAELGFVPFDFAGGGHIHIGSVFRDDPKLLRNFMVDYFNHPSLSGGALGNDPWNALSLTQMEGERRKAFAEVIADFDAGKILTTDSLARAVIERVYRGEKLDKYWAKKDRQWFNQERPARTHALNLMQLLEGLLGSGIGTVEVRAIFPQKSFGDFLNITELFARRITLLRELKEPLKFQSRVESRSAKKTLKEFSKFVREAEMNPARFQNSIHPVWRRSGEKIPYRCEDLFL